MISRCESLKHETSDSSAASLMDTDTNSFRPVLSRMNSFFGQSQMSPSKVMTLAAALALHMINTHTQGAGLKGGTGYKNLYSIGTKWDDLHSDSKLPSD